MLMLDSNMLKMSHFCRFLKKCKLAAVEYFTTICFIFLIPTANKYYGLQYHRKKIDDGQQECHEKSNNLLFCSLVISVFSDILHQAHLRRTTAPLYWDVGIEKGIKITIPACPAARLALLSCYTLLYAISCH